jgi:putative sterol carrier protein
MDAYQEIINNSPAYQKAAAEWRLGPVSLICKARPDLDIDEDVGIVLDLHEGHCRSINMCTAEEANAAPYCITATYERWKQIILGTLEPIQGIMQGKLRFQGNLPDVVKHVEASQVLVGCASEVPTDFVDE